MIFDFYIAYNQKVYLNSVNFKYSFFLVEILQAKNINLREYIYEPVLNKC